jgi:hypothetical protein
MKPALMWPVVGALAAIAITTAMDAGGLSVFSALVNAAVMGAIWGMLRWISGSVIVASVSHGLWNGGAYVLFGFGTKVGALGVENTAVFGPEATALGLWWKARRSRLA